MLKNGAMINYMYKVDRVQQGDREWYGASGKCGPLAEDSDAKTQKGQTKYDKLLKRCTLFPLLAENLCRIGWLCSR